MSLLHPTYPVIAPVKNGPQPVPLELAVGTAQLGPQRLIALQISSPSGVQLYFLQPDEAIVLATNIREAAGGIIVPKTPLRPVP